MEPVTVALPVYNDEGTLTQACDCLLAQTWRSLDIAIILNGSNAQTESTAQSLARRDQRIRLLRLKDPNLAAALNLALRESSSDFVARMDADDTCPPDRIARQVAHIKERPTLAALGCAYDVIGPQ